MGADIRIDNMFTSVLEYLIVLKHLLAALFRAQAVVVASGHDLGIIRDLFNGVDKGTIFMDRPPSVQVCSCLTMFSHNYHGSGGGAKLYFGGLNMVVLCTPTETDAVDADNSFLCHTSRGGSCRCTRTPGAEHSGAKRRHARCCSGETLVASLCH